MSTPVSSTSGSQTPRTVSLTIFSTVFLTFVGYLTVAMPLAVLPQYVTSTLGFNAVLAGFTISTQYLCTILSRPQVGRLSDLQGPKRAVLIGFSGCVLSGLLTFAAALCAGSPGWSLALILAGRLAIGISESWVGTAAITWAIGQVGSEHTVRIISWNGVASYGALGVGAPLGTLLVHGFGFASIGLATCLLGAIGLCLAALKPAVAIIAEKRLSMGRVTARVFPYGAVLALASCGFGVIAAFITLLFDSRGWPGAPFALTVFGLFFIVARLAFSRFILRYGGLRVTLLALVVELAGLLVLWAAQDPAAAMLGAALTGFGFAPVFPALGIVAVGKVPPQNRGAALGLYTVFFDVALAVQGPLAGFLIERFGMSAPFGLGAAGAGLALVMTAVMLAR